MHCMKCGREIKGEQVFCGECLQDMNAHPVKPGAAVQLPIRPASNGQKKSASRRKPLSPEEQAASLRKTVRRMTAAIVALAVCLCFTGAMLLHTLHLQWQQENIGKNYSTISPTENS